MRTFLLLLISWSAFAVAQSPVPKVVSAHSEQRAVTATKTGLNYELLISLPENYAATQDRYPVLFVLDGWHFPLMDFMQNNNRFSRRMPPVIIVTISHGSGNVMAARARDFTPTRVASVASSGGADAFLDFLELQLIPFIDQIYRTNPLDRAILGHSYGGLFALYAMQQRPKLFQRVVASSPTIGWDNRKLFQPARLKEFNPPVRVDISVEGEPPLRDDVVAFANLLDEVKPSGKVPDDGPQGRESQLRQDSRLVRRALLGLCPAVGRASTRHRETIGDSSGTIFRPRYLNWRLSQVS